MKIALVTGASSGIGRAAALALARDGYAVALAARRADRLAEVVRTIEAQHVGGRHVSLVVKAEGVEIGGVAGVAGGGVVAAEAFPTDLEARGAPAALVSKVLERFGRLDLLVNNAGWGYCAPLEHTPEEAARRIFELNLLVPFLLMRECLPHLRRTGGVIINVSSGSGLLPSPYYSAYAASKTGLVSLSNTLRVEQRASPEAPAVRVVSLCPGPVVTEFGKVAGGAPVHADSLGVRILTAEEVGAIIVRQARRPGRTVVPTAAVRAGALLHRYTPRLFERLVLGWARRVRPTIEKHLTDGQAKGR